jgi:hypothetical protein
MDWGKRSSYSKYCMEGPMDNHPLVSRTYKIKDPFKKFFCPLCRTERAFTHHYKLTKWNYLQIVLLTTVFSLGVWPIAEHRGPFSFFIFWAGFMWIKRLKFAKQIPCPHCGFDASWYKRDVTVAKKKVVNFWSDKGEVNTAPVEDEAAPRVHEEAPIPEERPEAPPPELTP